MAARVLLAHAVANLRDVGGLVPLGAGTLLRSSTLASLPGSTLDALTALTGPGRYVDLRTAPELEREGDVAPLVARGWEWEHRPVDDGGAGQQEPRGDPYERSRDTLAQHLAAALAIAARLGRERPTLVTCSLGKDRTGVVVALLLDALGVERAQIAADYVLSNACLAAQRHLLPQRWGGGGRPIRSVAARECLALLAVAEQVGATRELQRLLAAGAVSSGARR